METAVQEEQPKTVYEELSDEQKLFVNYDFWLKKYCEKVANYEGAKKQLQRIMFNAAVVHMSKEEPKFHYAEEKELFETFVELDSAKFLVLLHGLAKDGVIELKQPLLSKEANPPEKAKEFHNGTKQEEESTNR